MGKRIEIGGIVKWNGRSEWITFINQDTVDFCSFSNIPIEEITPLDYDFFNIGEYELPVSAIYQQGDNDPLIFMVHLPSLAKSKFTLN